MLTIAESKDIDEKSQNKQNKNLEMSWPEIACLVLTRSGTINLSEPHPLL
jgi:hypothetical protein